MSNLLRWFRVFDQSPRKADRAVEVVAQKFGLRAPLRVLGMLIDVVRSRKVRNIGAVVAHRIRSLVGGSERLWPAFDPRALENA